MRTKVPHTFLAKNLSPFGFMATGRLTESMTNDFVQLDSSRKTSKSQKTYSNIWGHSGMTFGVILE